MPKVVNQLYISSISKSLLLLFSDKRFSHEIIWIQNNSKNII